MFLSVHIQPYLNLQRDYCCLLDHPRDLYSTFMTLQESSYLLDSKLNLAIFINTGLDTTFCVEAHSVHAKQVLKIINTSSCTAHIFLPIEETSLTCSLDRSILTFCAFLLRSLTTLLLHSHPNLSTITNQIIIEGTSRFIKSSGQFKMT